MILSKEGEYNHFLLSVYEYFNENIYNVTFLNFDNIYLTDNIAEDLPLFGVNHDALEELQACTVTPNDVVSEMVILIDTHCVDTFIIAKSLVHELIHVYDFKEFAHKYTAGLIENINSHDLFEAYRFFSEFKAFGYSELYCLKLADEMYNTNNLDYIVNLSKKQFLSERIYLKRETFLKYGMSPYDLSRLFGEFLFFDLYNHVKNIKRSCVCEYTPIVFHSEIKNNMYSIYQICLDCSNDIDIFDYLVQLESLIDSVCQD